MTDTNNTPMTHTTTEKTDIDLPSLISDIFNYPEKYGLRKQSPYQSWKNKALHDIASMLNGDSALHPVISTSFPTQRTPESSENT